MTTLTWVGLILAAVGLGAYFLIPEKLVGIVLIAVGVILAIVAAVTGTPP